MGVWIVSGDRGTARLRLRLAGSDPVRLLAEVQSDHGIASTCDGWRSAGSPTDREAFFLRILAPGIDRLAAEAGRGLSGLPLVLAGMAWSSIGLRALPEKRSPRCRSAARRSRRSGAVPEKSPRLSCW